MIRLAIDPSTKSSGFAVFDDEKLVYYNCVTSSSQNTFKRIHKMAEAVDNLIQEYKPDQVIIEDVLAGGVWDIHWTRHKTREPEARRCKIC